MKFRQNYGEDRTRNKNGVGPIQPNPLILLARLEGFEPPTHGLEELFCLNKFNNLSHLECQTVA